MTIFNKSMDQSLGMYAKWESSYNLAYQDYNIVSGVLLIVLCEFSIDSILVSKHISWSLT